MPLEKREVESATAEKLQGKMVQAQEGVTKAQGRVSAAKDPKEKAEAARELGNAEAELECLGTSHAIKEADEWDEQEHLEKVKDLNGKINDINEKLKNGNLTPEERDNLIEQKEALDRELVEEDSRRASYKEHTAQALQQAWDSYVNTCAKNNQILNSALQQMQNPVPMQPPASTGGGSPQDKLPEDPSAGGQGGQDPNHSHDSPTEVIIRGKDAEGVFEAYSGEKTQDGDGYRLTFNSKKEETAFLTQQAKEGNVFKVNDMRDENTVGYSNGNGQYEQSNVKASQFEMPQNTADPRPS